MIASRLLAARIVNEVVHGHSLTDRLAFSLPLINDVRDRTFVQAVCYGVCRFYSRLEVVLGHLLKKPLKAKDSDVHALLLVGLYQLMEMRIPPHAAVAETVNATEPLKKPYARGLVNAVLREYLRSKEQIEKKIQSNIEAVYAHPLWWIEAIKNAWPDHWQEILSANNAHPPFALRVNQQRLSRDDYLNKLRTKNLSAEIIPETQSGIVLKSPVPIEELPGFTLGEVFVQDGAAQLAAEWLALRPKQRVLDACAAPGGKLTHILDIEPDLSACIAVEKDPKRLALIKDNLTRLRLQAQLICHDVSDVKSWWDGHCFDRILLDAPCSSSGVIRRHPDIKLLRKPSDIDAFSARQFQLLESLWPLLKMGGLLVYATCSIFPDENVNVIQRFCRAHPDAKEEKMMASWGVPCAIGRQILTGMHHMDGFYYARLRK